MELHIVNYTAPGYAREDAGSPGAVGAYRDRPTADKVALLQGACTITTVEVDAIPPGLVARATELGISLTPTAKP